MVNNKENCDINPGIECLMLFAFMSARALLQTRLLPVSVRFYLEEPLRQVGGLFFQEDGLILFSGLPMNCVA
jgi:hypothetical protein